MNISDPHEGRGFVLPFHKKNTRATTAPQKPPENRIPGLGWIPNSFRNHFVAMSGELAGTFLFLFFALSGAQVANSVPTTSAKDGPPTGANVAQLLYISLCFGFSLAVNAWVFFRISGGLFNPAVTLGMCLVGALPYFRGLLIFIAQILGAMTAAAVVSALFPGQLNVLTALGGGATIVQGLFIEMFLTAQLVFTIFMLAAEKHRGTFIAPVGIGLSLFIAELTGVYYTGGSVNPARSFGPAVVARDFVSYHWIYWIGPFLGAIVAAGFYKFIKMLEYETANPGQDEEDERHVPNEDDDPAHVKHPRDHDEQGNRKGHSHDRSHSGSRSDTRGNNYSGNEKPYSPHNQHNAIPDGHVTGPTDGIIQYSNATPQNAERYDWDQHQRGNPLTAGVEHEAAGGMQRRHEPIVREEPHRSAEIPYNPVQAPRSTDPSLSNQASGRTQPTHNRQASRDGETSYSMDGSRGPGRYEYDNRGNMVQPGYLPEGVPAPVRTERRSLDRNPDRNSRHGDKALPFPPSVGRV
ncbi:MAG: hypothetical protein M1817_004651 [Caeruleum heppii]|nr:MAG: hypothetical protein M1817_004651 [Caeruleum heppii]